MQGFLNTGFGKVVKGIGMGAVAAIPGVGPAALVGLKATAGAVRNSGWLAPDSEAAMNDVFQSVPMPMPETGAVIQPMVRQRLTDPESGNMLQTDPRSIMSPQNRDWVERMSGGTLNQEAARRLAGMGLTKLGSSANMSPLARELFTLGGNLIGNNVLPVSGMSLDGRSARPQPRLNVEGEMSLAVMPRQDAYLEEIEEVD